MIASVNHRRYSEENAALLPLWQWQINAESHGKIGDAWRMVEHQNGLFFPQMFRFTDFSLYLHGQTEK